MPPGTYKALTDINININGVTLEAPTGATIVFGNPSGLQFFVRGNGERRCLRRYTASATCSCYVPLSSWMCLLQGTRSPTLQLIVLARPSVAS